MLDYKNVSLADQVYEKMESNILNGVYGIGEVISEARLSEELGVSRTPIREALARLEGDNLVEESPAGVLILGITEKDVMDMFEVKRRLEAIATRWAAERITGEDLDKLEEVLEQQEFFAEKQNAGKVRDLDTQFHDVIYASCGSRIFQEILSEIHHKLQKYRKDSLEHNPRIFESVDEHRQILEAMRERNGDRVQELAQEHVEKVYEGIEKRRN